jgi:hypothetical protein
MTAQSRPGTDPPPYGPQPPLPPQPPRGRWLGGGATVMIIVVALVIGVLVTRGDGSSTSQGRHSSGGVSQRDSASGSVLVPSACPTSSQPSVGTGPWKLVQPQTLCGIPSYTTAAAKQANQELVSLLKLKITESSLTGPSAGSYTSSAVGRYQYQPGTVSNLYRLVVFAGLDGRFNVAAAMNAFEIGDGMTYKKLPPGPHGGMLACELTAGQPTCVFATSTTVCQFLILDTTHELAARLAANALSIRDAIEVRA